MGNVQVHISDVSHVELLLKDYMVQLNNHYGHNVFLSFWNLEKSGIRLAKTVNHVRFLTRCKSSDIVKVWSLSTY
jgi:hypothetical protein